MKAQNHETPPQLSDSLYYSENMSKCLQNTGIRSFDYNFNGVQISVYGLPSSDLDQSQLFQFNKELSDLVISKDPSSITLVQIDPTFHIWEKRKLEILLKEQLYYKGMNKNQKVEISDSIIPLNFSELFLNFLTLEIPLSNEEQLKQLLESYKSIIESQKNDSFSKLNFQGYFSEYFIKHRGTDILMTEKGQEMMKELSTQFDKKIFNDDNHFKGEFKLISMLKLLNGCQIFLIDIPEIYHRITMGLSYSVEELRQIYVKLLDFMKENNLTDTKTMQYTVTGNMLQFPIDYYLYYMIQKSCIILKQDLEKTKLEDSEGSNNPKLSVYISDIHLEPLKILMKFHGEDGFKKDQDFSQFLKLNFPEDQNDLALIEKQAILDSMNDTQIWNQPYIKNPFPYIKQNYLELTPEEQKTIQKQFYVQQQKYQKLKAQYLRK